MHSSTLRGSDFDFTVSGSPVSHQTFFESFTIADRLGIVTSHPLDGLGAVTLLMSYVTAFYDHYRTSGDDFFAYPDFFCFQRKLPLVHYGMFDIWPEEKNLHLARDQWEVLSMISSRAITVLLIPLCSGSTFEQPEEDRDRARLESFRQNVHACYTYSPGGIVEGGDTVVSTASESIRRWGTSVLEANEAGLKGHRQNWENGFQGETLTQSFKQINVDEALCCLQHL